MRAVVFTALISGNALASTDTCKPIRDAINRQNAASDMQVSSVLIYTDSGRSYSYDYLIAGDKFYSRNRSGPWKVEPRWPTPLVVDGKPAVYDCRFVGTDRIGETTVMVYTYKRFVPDHTMEVRAWVAADSKDFLETETNIGPFSDHKTRFSFNYKRNITLPEVDEP
ncbi:hypothetical protein [Rhizobium sp. P44RR-XXIV]|uniref:hypothetical protein n=1 Tax=Rhizobium sp. P44RR-XXIV TaxID=1921145 RepID=UPI0010AB1981|nr:hypothetical protein [Rhizobium sp. P44RR-XXIV]TIX89173.1 hypothetical protein BSK43_021440 [Rhizobium sp. P44RR-XXIV]